MVLISPQKQFLFDFGIISKQDFNRLANREEVDRYKGEGDGHYNCKKEIYNSIKDCMIDYENFYIFNELKQVRNPFSLRFYSRENVKVRLDVCCVALDHRDKPFVFDIEVDGWEHFTKKGMIKGETRDTMISQRYGSFLERVDYEDYSIAKIKEKIMLAYLEYV